MATLMTMLMTMDMMRRKSVSVPLATPVADQHHVGCGRCQNRPDGRRPAEEDVGVCLSPFVYQLLHFEQRIYGADQHRGPGQQPGHGGGGGESVHAAPVPLPHAV